MGSHISSKMMNKKLKSKGDFLEAKNIILEEHKMNDLKDIKKLFNLSYMDIENFEHSFRSTLDELKYICGENMANFCAIWDYKHRQNRYIPDAIFR